MTKSRFLQEGINGRLSRKSVDNHNVLPVTWYFKCKRKSYREISKFKARYCVRGGVQKILYPEPLNLYSLVVQWSTVRFMLNLQCVLGLQSQIIDLKNAFPQEDIPSGDPISIELPRQE